jgi:hypothetical protein
VDVSGHLSSSNDCGGGPLWPFVDGGWALIAKPSSSFVDGRAGHPWMFMGGHRCSSIVVVGLWWW